MTDDAPASDKLKALRNRTGLSTAEFARRMGMRTSSYANYEHRFKKPYLPMDLVKSLSAVFVPLGISAEEVLALAGVDKPEAAPALVKAAGTGKLVPVYAVAASAGSGALVVDEGIVSSVAFPPNYLGRLTRANPRNLAIISVKGDSMVPTLADDDLVMLDTSKIDLSYDGLFVLRDNGDGLLVKRVGRGSRRGRVMLISDNRDLYPAVEREADEIEVLGKVIWVGRKV